MCCFPLVINGFCSNNSFYSASLSFAIYFEADLSLLLITKALLRKQLCNVVPCEFTFVFHCYVGWKGGGGVKQVLRGRKRVDHVDGLSIEIFSILWPLMP